MQDLNTYPHFRQILDAHAHMQGLLGSNVGYESCAGMTEDSANGDENVSLESDSVDDHMETLNKINRDIKTAEALLDQKSMDEISIRTECDQLQCNLNAYDADFFRACAESYVNFVVSLESPQDYVTFNRAASKFIAISDTTHHYDSDENAKAEAWEIINTAHFKLQADHESDSKKFREQSACLVTLQTEIATLNQELTALKEQIIEVRKLIIIFKCMI